MSHNLRDCSGNLTGTDPSLYRTVYVDSLVDLGVELEIPPHAVRHVPGKPLLCFNVDRNYLAGGLVSPSAVRDLGLLTLYVFLRWVQDMFEKASDA